MKIKRTGYYKTRDGRTVEVFDIDWTKSFTNYPIRGTFPGTSVGFSWTKSGSFLVSGRRHDFDLIKYLGPLNEPTSKPKEEPKMQLRTDLNKSVSVRSQDGTYTYLEISKNEETGRLQGYVKGAQGENVMLDEDLILAFADAFSIAIDEM